MWGVCVCVGGVWGCVCVGGGVGVCVRGGVWVCVCVCFTLTLYDPCLKLNVYQKLLNGWICQDDTFLFLYPIDRHVYNTDTYLSLFKNKTQSSNEDFILNTGPLSLLTHVKGNILSNIGGNSMYRF